MLVKLRRFLPYIMLLLWDFISVFFSVYGAGLIVSSDMTNQPDELLIILTTFGIFVLTNIVCRCYNGVWRRIGILDGLKAVLSVLFTVVVVVCWTRFNRSMGMDLSTAFFILMFVFLTMLTIAGRCAVKAYSTIADLLKGHNRVADKDVKRILIYGAGAAGSFFAQKISLDNEGYRVLGFVDDDQTLIGKSVSGAKILGGVDQLSELITKTDAQGVIVAIPTISPDRLEYVINTCKNKSIFVKRFASIDDASNLRHASVQDIRIEDLLHRDSVSLDMEVVKNFVKDKTVVVTGGAGSIGSEICRQVLKFGCKKLVVFDFNENGLFFIGNELIQKGYEGRFELRLGSIRDRKRLDEVFTEFAPQIVFHAAAHKHVPMMEINPCEAVKNNVFGTVNVCQEAVLHKVEKFILISTDKAVNPTNIMGATKRIAELIIQLFDSQCEDTDFAAVRFGNVLGSNGSVVPFFKDQIARGGPVTVTHPDMRRYFMTIPEACQLVLEAGAMVNGGEIFVLDMGQPVKIYDLACDMIRLSGLVPEKDIKIVFTGLRPGEKLFEEISMADEDVDKTSNKKIVIMKPIPFDQNELAELIKGMKDFTTVEEKEKMFDRVQVLVPTFKHNK